MLTSDLVLTRSRGPYISPCTIDAADPGYIDLAQDLIGLFAEHQGRTRGELYRALDTRAGDATDYRVQRGLAKLLEDDRCEFQVMSVAPPEDLRATAFALARENHPVVREPDLIYPVTRDHVLEQVALKHEVPASEVAQPPERETRPSPEQMQVDIVLEASAVNQADTGVSKPRRLSIRSVTLGLSLFAAGVAVGMVIMALVDRTHG